MTRNEIYNEFAKACVTVNGTFQRDDQVERAYARWQRCGAPKGATITIENDGKGDERITVAYDAPIFLGEEL